MKHLTKAQVKTFSIEVLMDLLGSLLYGVGAVCFAAASNFAPGGVSGVAILLNKLIGVPIGLATFLINIPIILLTFKTLGKSFLLRSLKTIIISWLITDYVVALLPVYSAQTVTDWNPILSAVFGGLLAGLGLVLIYVRDSSTGGSDFVIMCIRKKKPHLSLGNISLIVDGSVIVMGAFVYNNINAMLYGFVMTLVYSVLIDKMMYGFNSSKMVIIISEKGEEIAKQIGVQLERGVTISESRGTYTGKPKKTLLCACSNSEVHKIKKISHVEDPGAFVIITSADSTYGEGFFRLAE